MSNLVAEMFTSEDRNCEIYKSKVKIRKDFYCGASRAVKNFLKFFILIIAYSTLTIYKEIYAS